MSSQQETGVYMNFDEKKSLPKKGGIRNLVVKVTILLIAFIVLIFSGIILYSYLKSSNGPEINPIPQKIDHDTTPLINYFKEEAGVTLPFTLKFSESNQMKPEWVWSPFEGKTEYDRIKGTDNEYSSTITKTNYDRAIKAGLNLDMSGLFSQILFGSAIKLGNIAAEFKDHQSKKTYKSAVWFKIQKEIVKIDASKISLTQFYIDKFKKILNSDDDSETKKQNFIDIFDNYGYYVPVEIGMGGKFSFIFEEESESSANAIIGEITADISEVIAGASGSYDKNITNYSSSLKISYYGGENVIVTGSANLGAVVDWINSINEENYLPVYYSAMEPIYTFLPEEIKQKYEDFKFKEAIEKRFKNQYEKYKICEEAVDQTISFDEVETEHTSYPYGLMPGYSPNYIKTKTVNITEDKDVFGRKEKVFYHSLSNTQKIVGFTIIQNKSSLLSGWYKLIENPFISSGIRIWFKSAWNSAMDWTVEIYYTDWDN